jgi:hypothetical protein
MVALLFIRRDAKKSFRFAAIALLFVAPCVIRNFIFYGNPIYPYFHEWFQQNPLYAVEWREFQKEAWGRQWGSILAQPKLLAEALFQPLFLTYRGNSNVDYIGPLFLAALPLIFFRRGDDRHRIWLIVFAGLSLSWWLTTTMPRFFLPGLAILAACFCLRFPAYSQKWIRWSLAVIMVAIIFHNTAGFSQFAYGTGSWDYLIFGETKSEYLRKPHVGYPSPYFASADWINANTPSAARVMVIGDGRGAYLERPYLAVARSNRDPLFIWVQQSKSAADLKRLLDGERIRYLLINMAEITRRPRTPKMTAEDLEVIETFFRMYAVNRFADRVHPRLRWTEVWEIVPSAFNPDDRKYSLVEWFRFQSKSMKVNPSDP